MAGDITLTSDEHRLVLDMIDNADEAIASILREFDLGELQEARQDLKDAVDAIEQAARRSRGE